jgi:Uma2 family endonuclease
MPVSPPIQHVPNVPRKAFSYKDVSPTTGRIKFKPAPIELINDLREEEPPLESDWHVAAMNLLLDIMEYFWNDRTDVYISGNTAVRFDPARHKNRHVRGPDFYVIKNVPKGFRESWVTWEENGLTPDLIVELASKTTAHVDLHEKKEVYEQKLKTAEYVIYNPQTDQLQGWRLTNKRYQPIKPNQDGWLWLKEVDLWIGVVEHQFPRARGTLKTPRFFDQNGQLLPTAKEAEAQARRAAEAEIARLKALLAEKT